MNFDVKNIFLEALDYPHYVRPFFFIKKQKELGWHKEIFLNGLINVYFHYDQIFEMKLSAAKGKNPESKIDDVSLSIDEETEGKYKGILTKKIIDELDISILTAFEIDKPQKQFSDVEIINFTEYALWFIKNEFKIQIGEIQFNGFRPRTKTYFVYLIASEAPFLNFPKFKSAVQTILWNGNNNSILKKSLKNYHKAANEIVEIWNSKLFKLQQKFYKNTEDDRELPETIKMEFKHEGLSHSWWNDDKMFNVKNPKRYLNQDLAQFAADITNFLASEIKETNKEDVEVSQKDFVSDFLKGIHELQKDGVLQSFIKSIKDKKEKVESPFSIWFKNWFKAADYYTEVEALKGNGRIDLRVSHVSIGNKIVEFKGWWNGKKNNIVTQLNSYITESENEGYIFLIDDSKNGVVPKYKAIITNASTGYLNDSWHYRTYNKTNYKVYLSNHFIKGDEKTLYHFIFSINKL
jgi:hypothetical protein